MWRNLAQRRPSGRPLLCQLLARRGWCDGRNLTCWALNVSRGLGQIRVASGFLGCNLQSLGSLACVAKYWSSAASDGRSRLPCHWCIAPLHGSAQPKEPRLCPGDPAETPERAPTFEFMGVRNSFRHSCLRPEESAPLKAVSWLRVECIFPWPDVSSAMALRRWQSEFNEFTDDGNVTGIHVMPHQSSSNRRHATTQQYDARACKSGSVRHAHRRVDFYLPVSPILMDNDTSSTSTKPLKTFRHRGISASVFENESEKGDLFYKVQIVRTYKDGKKFHSTPTFSRDELPLVILVTQQAFDFVLCEERDNKTERARD